LDTVFRTWQLFGKYPYTTDEIVGRQATMFFLDAQQMLAIILKERNSLKGIYGILQSSER
jgi:cobalamin-dependent methionine synthase I